MNFSQSLIFAYFLFVPFSHILLSFLFDYNEDQMTKKKLMLYICACIGWPILIPVGFIKFFITYWKSLPYDSQTIDEEEEVCKPKSFDEPDWSKAPNWANYYGIDADGQRWWYEFEPELKGIIYNGKGEFDVDNLPERMKLFKRPEKE